MKPAIRVENLSKQYRLGTRGKDQYSTLRESLAFAITAPFRRRFKEQRQSTAHDNTFWALKDVSFEVQPGEVVGIIGRNGAGKSTLLKILSRIVEPTEGRAEFRGRISSLLEVGTGFHPELSGRENIYLNGSILGMKHKEIDRKFDEIVAFSEIEQFLDTPVKRYSSGMYVRLAFAVAAHLEPEILIVDEVLAVGDSGFQKKCLGKMADVARAGRTVLLVSHNMAAVQNLCEKILVLSRGRNTYIGDTSCGIKNYMCEGVASAAEFDLAEHPSRRQGCQPLLESVRFRDRHGNLTDRFQSGDAMRIELDLNPVLPLHDPQFGIGVDDTMATRIFSFTTYYTDTALQPILKRCTVCCDIEELPLVPGRYFVSLSAGTPHNKLLDAIDHAGSFDVESGDFFGNGRLPGADLGRVLIRSAWSKVNSVPQYQLG